MYEKPTNAIVTRKPPGQSIFKRRTGEMSNEKGKRDIGPESLASKYAASDASPIYHMVTRDEVYTVCGLRLRLFTAGSIIHLAEKLRSKNLCRHCERINDNEQSI